MTHLVAGDKAPQFSLEDQQGNRVSLSDFKGQRVVVYFYPKAMTPGCIMQAEGIRDSKDALDDMGVKVIGISNDAVTKLARFEEKKELNFTLLSDEDHAVTESYGIWQLKKFMGREFMGLVRTTFIVGADGKIEAVLDKFKTKSHHETLLQWLAENP